MKTLIEARDILCKHFHLSQMLKSETIPAPEAVGRVLSKPVSAQLSAPHFHAAAMDGIAVKAEKTFGAHESLVPMNQNPKNLWLIKMPFM